MTRRKAEEVYLQCEDTTRNTFKASRGWLDKFMTRHELSVRRRTTVAQKSPHDMIEKMVSFVRFMEKARVRISATPAEIIAMDETAVWFDMVGASTVHATGAKSISVKSTSHEKSRFTVILTASGSGTKYKPYVVFMGGSKKVKEINDTRRANGLIVTSSANGWMNDELTKDYLQRVIGKLAFKKRLLVWDAYRCHLSQSTKDELKHNYNITTAVIP